MLQIYYIPRTNSQGGTSTGTVFAADCVHGSVRRFLSRPAHVGFLAAPTDPLLPTYLHTHTRPQETKGAFGPKNPRPIAKNIQ